jgi:spore maturation protein CgeB
MEVAFFYHSLLSDWNHGNAHFLRGIASELIDRGIGVRIFEPENSWSYQNLVQDQGEQALADFTKYYPQLISERYRELELDRMLDGVSMVLVHEWNSPAVVQEIGNHRAKHGYKLLFHDTHHRAVTAPEEMKRYALSYYDGVLAYGEILKNIYLENGWTSRAWTWHEAADTRLFRPISYSGPKSDVVWIGNWGDEERTAELQEFLIRPLQFSGAEGAVYGVRYPKSGLETLANAKISYRNWTPNFKVPEIFSRFKLTVHIPRRPYVERLHGIPTIRPFEALACGIPLISAPWVDKENLFTPGSDFLVARTGDEMSDFTRQIIENPRLANSLSAHGLKTILARHTCVHRVDELLHIYNELES